MFDFLVQLDETWFSMPVLKKLSVKNKIFKRSKNTLPTKIKGPKKLLILIRLQLCEKWS